ncbi:hypothetical protein DRE_05375 [Drechslerella stenobrocha 248]|uniref:Peroxisomal membrane protein PEX13 n=1 Tax=Drechslerella stenobrocha 248 TaxID=1043628 RepID=W7HZ95_9PEZI|nr:hypothetical protein DRE_05375 [Drechslerella stenobrocha 248]
MSGVSPPKPWELAGVTATPTPSTSAAAMATASAVAPALPARPAALASTAVNRMGVAATGYGGYQNRLGTGYGMGSGYGSYGSYSSPYSSPYSRFGGGGYGAYSGYGGGYAGYGMGGGYGGFGGMGQDPNDPNSLMRGMENSTAATFQMIESIVGAFGSFAQMLESTFMATHSSFFAMVSVAEQFGNLRTTLGQILGIFAVIRWIRAGWAKLTGRPIPASVGELTPDAFASFTGGASGAPGHRSKSPSKKPFVIFLVAVFGLPYLMGKLIRALASKQEEEDRRRQEAMNAAAGGQSLDLADPMKKLDFCKVLYDFAPENPAVELEVKKGDLVAVLSKLDPLGNASQWWKCRTKDARIGYLPEPYLEPLVRSGQVVSAAKQITDGSTSRTQTMTASSLKNSVPIDSRTHTMTTTKPGDISLESFQKSNFFNS